MFNEYVDPGGLFDVSKFLNLLEMNSMSMS